MMKEIDLFLRDNFEISLETYLRMTDSRLKRNKELIRRN